MRCQYLDLGCVGRHSSGPSLVVAYHPLGCFGPDRHNDWSPPKKASRQKPGSLPRGIARSGKGIIQEGEFGACQPRWQRYARRPRGCRSALLRSANKGRRRVNLEPSRLRGKTSRATPTRVSLSPAARTAAHAAVMAYGIMADRYYGAQLLLRWPLIARLIWSPTNSCRAHCARRPRGSHSAQPRAPPRTRWCAPWPSWPWRCCKPPKG